MILIEEEKTWPQELIDFLDAKKSVFAGWECCCARQSSSVEYDHAIYEMRSILKKYSIVGYHCTKLTQKEICDVGQFGLKLQDGASLRDRIDRLVAEGHLDKSIAGQLKQHNQADDTNRANMLWFCFFEPHEAGQGGIERFFRCWGGEALYNSHERNPETGRALRSIGLPCVVKVDLPLVFIDEGYLPDSSMISAFLCDRGHKVTCSILSEGCSINNVESKYITKIMQYPEDDFVNVTRCQGWDERLENLDVSV